MYRVNGEQCKKCGKLFRPDAKVVKMVDADGNELHIDLCNSCELDTMVEEVINLKHISREEAEKYLYKYMWDEAYKIISNMNLYSEDEINEIIDLWNKTPNISNVMMASEVPNAVVRMVKNNE